MSKVKRIEGKVRKNASFTDFNATVFDSVDVYDRKKDNTDPDKVLVGRSGNDEDNMFMNAELCSVQDKNPEVKILVNTEGNIAELGEEGEINLDLSYARIDGNLMLAEQ